MSLVAHIMLLGVLSSRGHTFFMELTAFTEFTSFASVNLCHFSQRSSDGPYPSLVIFTINRLQARYYGV